MPKKEPIKYYTALKISILYLIISGMWILFSDMFLQQLTSNIAVLTRLQIFKGWFFVLITSIMLYVLIKRDLFKIGKFKQEIISGKERLKSAFEEGTEGIWNWDLESNQLLFSNSWKEMLEYKEYEIGSSREMWLSIIHPDDREWVSEEFEKYLKGKIPYYVAAYRIKQKNGNYKWILDTGKIISYNNQQKPAKIIGNYTDLTNRNDLVKKLSLSEEKFSKIFQTSPDSILITRESDGKCLDINENFTLLSGYTTDDIKNNTTSAINIWADPKERDKFIKILRNNGSVKNFEAEFKVKNGTRRVGLVSARLIEIDGERCILSITRDITKRKKYEQAIIDSEDRYKNLVELSPVGILLLKKGKIIFLNSAIVQMFGYTNSEELIGHDFTELVHPDNLKMETNRIFKLSSKSGSFVEPLEERFIKRDNNILYAITYGQSMTYNDELIVQQYVVDVTESKYAAEKLKQSEASLLLAQKIANLGKWEWDLVSNQVFISKELYNLMDVLPKDSDSFEEILKYIHPDDKKALLEKLDVTLKDKLPFDSEYRLIKADGEIRILHLEGAVSCDINNAPIKIYGIAHDITKQRHAEEQLRILSSAVEQSSASVIITNTSGTIEFINKKCTEVSGYTLEEVKGKNPRIFKSGESSEKIYEGLWSNVLSGKDWRGEFHNKKKNGELFWESALIAPIRNEKDEITHLVAVKEDITEKKKAQEILKASEVKFKTLFNHAGDAVFIIGLDGKNIEVNEIACKRLGYTREELLNMYVHDFNVGDEEALIKERITEIAKFKNCIYQVEHKTKDGRIIPTEISTNLINYEGKDVILSIARDITERKKVEEELLRAKQRAEEMNKLKSNFLANMSHELRTPLVAILGYTDILKEEIQDEDKKGMVKSIYEGGRRLLKTLNLLLDLARIEANKIEITLTEINIPSVVLAVKKIFDVLAQKKNLYLNCEIKDENVSSLLDQRMFEEILNNIIGNAIKYTEKGGVTLIVDREIDNGKEYAVINVIDTGIGIPQESNQLVFEEFRQLSEGWSRNFDGTGLGLTISQKFAEMMHGKILLKSKVNSGSTFSIRFPVSTQILLFNSDKEKINKTEHLEKSVSNTLYIPKTDNNKNLPPVLLVEDDNMSRNVTKLLISKVCSVDTAVDGITAIELASRKKYKAILMDINLGKGMTGIEATKEIKKLPGYDKTPIVALTAFAMMGDKEEFLNHGCTHYLAKPFDKKTINNLIKQLLDPYEYA